MVARAAAVQVTSLAHSDKDHPNSNQGGNRNHNTYRSYHPNNRTYDSKNRRYNRNNNRLHMVRAFNQDFREVPEEVRMEPLVETKEEALAHGGGQVLMEA